MIAILNNNINEALDSKFYIIVQLYFFFFFNNLYVRHGLNKQVSAYKFLAGIARVLTSIKMYHITRH